MFGVGVGGLSNFSSEHITDVMAKQRVKQMKESFAILEFHFYNAFDGYSTPPEVLSTTSWTRPAPLTVMVDTAIVRAYIEEIRTPPKGRAWLAVNAMACDPGQCSPTLGSHMVENTPYLDVVAPNAQRAAQIAPVWAAFAQSLGYHGIFWSTMGQYGSCEGCDWPGFLSTAHSVLTERGLEQNAEFIDGYGWDNGLRAGVNPAITFPVFSLWGDAQSVETYKSQFYALGSGCWTTSQKVEDGAAIDTIIQRMLEANCHNAGYEAIVDGQRRIFSDYYPASRKMTDAEVERISTAISSPNPLPGCADSRMYLEAHGLAHGVDLGLDAATFEFQVDWHSVDPTAFLDEFKQSLLAAGTDISHINQMELRIFPGTTPESPAPASVRRLLGTAGRLDDRRLTGTVVVHVTGYPEDVSATRAVVAEHPIVVNGITSCESDEDALEGGYQCGATTSTTLAATVTTTAATTTTTTPPTTTTTTTAYNCSEYLATCEQEWTEEKLEYCTAHDVPCNITVNETNDTEVVVMSFSCLGDEDWWPEERREYCCTNEFIGCDDDTPLWKEVLLIVAVAAIAIAVACVAAIMCKKKRMSFREREPKIISQVPLTASGDEPVDEELQTPLVMLPGTTPR